MEKIVIHAANQLHSLWCRDEEAPLQKRYGLVYLALDRGAERLHFAAAYCEDALVRYLRSLAEPS